MDSAIPTFERWRTTRRVVNAAVASGLVMGFVPGVVGWAGFVGALGVASPAMGSSANKPRRELEAMLRTWRPDSPPVPETPPLSVRGRRA